MKESILKRYPTLSFDDVSLRDDGKGIYIDVWKSKETKPTMAQVLAWVAEDAKQPKPSVEDTLVQMEKDVADLWYAAMMGGLA